MDYALLGIGDAASVVTAVDIHGWGSEVIVSCRYDPLGTPKPYKLIFENCKEVRSYLLDGEALQDGSADLIGFSRGDDDCREPAVITTDIFELSILYGVFRVEK